ncbi:GMC oxidoreductase [Macrolepiota fuliginosa MF-IS2]|uniref:pyranose dehydrogenase (acceptor) n=1 Tax=Macrolepiota fuliginosa MF-IS2 TaxID=1400762 RepID=A0A9P6BZ69_9AGAR|nr:GMC oxidoreductase [Macrolepiota fuliginosa MF-IS2]
MLQAGFTESFHLDTRGGGNAGSVVAARLSENQDFKILVVEAGPSNEEIPVSQIPGLSHDIGVYGTRVDWNYTMTPQTHVNGRADTYPRAMMLGGCTSHNEMMYTRGSRDDYDRWASVTGDDNLAWDNIFHYILKVGPPLSLSEVNHYDPAVHGVNGTLETSAPYYLHPFNDVLFEAIKEQSDEFPYLVDMNGGRPIGMGWDHDTISGGYRSSSATAYLAPSGDNVHILLNTRVTRILPTTNSNGTDIRKIEFTTSPDGPRSTLTAKKELILSGGVTNTPQILLNSGIGPSDELEALNISTLINNPSVGKNFSDQPAVPLGFTTNLPTDDFNVTEALAQWHDSHTGRLATSPHLSPLGWVRFPDSANPFQDGSPDPTGGPDTPHVEIFFRNITALPSSTDGNASIIAYVVNINPVSRGSITLASSSPFDAPLIDPNFLAEPIDTAIILEGIRSALRLFSAQAFSGVVFGTNSPAPNANGTLTDEVIVDFIQHNATPFIHGVASCSMGPHGADWGVVDPEFKVRGVTGLRIVDASVIPVVPSGHTQASVYAISEWGSEVIKRAWN